jgi:hypothetical protein
MERTANWCSHGGWFTLADYDMMLALEFELQLALALGFRVVFKITLSASQWGRIPALFLIFQLLPFTCAFVNEV